MQLHLCRPAFVRIAGNENSPASLPAQVRLWNDDVGIIRNRNQVWRYIPTDGMKYGTVALAKREHVSDVLVHRSMVWLLELLPIQHGSIQPSAPARVLSSEEIRGKLW